MLLPQVRLERRPFSAVHGQSLPGVPEVGFDVFAGTGQSKGKVEDAMIDWWWLLVEAVVVWYLSFTAGMAWSKCGLPWFGSEKDK